MKSAVTVTLVPETRGGPFVFSAGLADAFARAAALGFDAVEVFPSSAAETDAAELAAMCSRHGLKVAAIGTGAGWVRHRLRLDRKSTRLNSSHSQQSRMPSSA